MLADDSKCLWYIAKDVSLFTYLQQETVSLVLVLDKISDIHLALHTPPVQAIHL